MRVGIVLDLRNPPSTGRAWPDVYAAALEFIEEADRLGLDVAVGEHHFWDDGYMPQPLAFLAAAAARTSQARLATSISIAPLHHPVELAEQAAVVDCLSGGRLELGFGTGYRVPEFAVYGVDVTRRLALYEERISAIRTLWADGTVTPQPVQDSIPLWAGLRGPRGAYLAGRLGMGMLYLPERPWDDYLRGLEDGGTGASPRLGGPVYAMLSSEPDAAWAELGPHIEDHWHAYDRHTAEGVGEPPAPLAAADYRRIGPFAAPVDAAATRVTIGFGVYTPEEAAAAVRSIATGRTIDWVYFPATLGSRFGERAYEHLRLLATELPALVGAF